MLWRAAMKPRQLAIAVSIGASARPIMMDAAIIEPAVISPLDHQIGADAEHRRLQQRRTTLEMLP